MGKRKTKATESTQSDLFKTLFGDAPGQNEAVSSLFSDENPFRRKPKDSIPVENTKTVDPTGSDTVELKKTKRKKEKSSSFDSSSVDTKAEETLEAPLQTKKAKKDKKLGSDNNDTMNVDEEENPGAVDSDKKKKKKRKRDEVERQYEEKKYGVKVVDKAGDSIVDGKETVGKKLVGEKRKKVDDAADSMVSKEGFDDESKLLRTVFVGNLPLNVKKKVILKEFSKFGEVESVRIRSVPIAESKKPRKGAIMQKQLNENASSVHAYVVFETEQFAEASLANNMALVEGNHIRVDRACPPRKKLKADSDTLYDNKRTLFVGNLPFDVKDEELYQLFCGINNVGSSLEAVRVVRDPHNSVGKGIAYVLFKTREAAHTVVKKGNLKLRDRELRISHSKADSTPSKRKLSSSEASDSKSPAKKFASGSKTFSGKDNNNRSDTTKAAMSSYQGLRANKADTSQTKSNHKKSHLRSSGPVQMKRQVDKVVKVREQKRPSVVARKAKANAARFDGVTKQTGTKRKPDTQTPSDRAHQKKKAKRF